MINKGNHIQKGILKVYSKFTKGNYPGLKTEVEHSESNSIKCNPHQKYSKHPDFHLDLKEYYTTLQVTTWECYRLKITTF